MEGKAPPFLVPLCVTVGLRTGPALQPVRCVGLASLPTAATIVSGGAGLVDPEAYITYRGPFMEKDTKSIHGNLNRNIYLK